MNKKQMLLTDALNGAENRMKIFLQRVRVILLLAVFSFMSCEKTKDLPVETLKQDDLEVEQIKQLKNLCAGINYGFEDINAITMALRDGESIVSITRGENNENTMSFLSGKTTDFYDWSGHVLKYPFIGLSLDESGELCWVIVDNCSRNDIAEIAQGYYAIDNELIEKLYLSYGEKVPVNGEIKLEFDEASRAFHLYEGKKLLHVYNDLIGYYYCSGIESRNIRSFVEGDDCVEFELLDGNIFTVPKFTLSLSLDLSELAFKKGGDCHNIHYKLSNVMDKATLDAEVSNGWQVSITPETSTSGTITFTAPETIEETTIIITAKEADRAATCELQCGKPKFSLAQSEFSVGYEGGIVSTSVKSNIKYHVDIPDDAKSWVSKTDAGPEAGADAVALTLSENEGVTSRNADISLLDEDGDVLGIISIKQAWNTNKTIEIYVSEKGELKTMLESQYDSKNIRRLKISGDLNYYDLVNIRTFQNVESLDITEVDGAETLYEDYFSGWTALKSVYIPTSCKTIDKNAFRGCTSLVDVLFPTNSQLQLIGENAFYNCTALRTITVPASCETIGNAAFKRCRALGQVSFESGSILKSIDGGIDSANRNYVGAFCECSALESITIPASCETIGVAAFRKCSALKQVLFEKGAMLRSMKSRAFEGCIALSKIEIPSSCMEIEDAFYQCSSLETVSFEQGSELQSLSETFFQCKSLKAIVIPASCETIDHAFWECSSLASVSFEAESRLSIIGPCAFAECPALKTVEIPASCETIEHAAFRSCKSLTAVSFPPTSSLKSINSECGNETFGNCVSLASITIPASCKEIGYGAFSGCRSLVNLAFEGGSVLSRIGSSAFCNCDLRVLDLRNCMSLTAIGSQSFSGNSQLSVIKIGAATPPYLDWNAFDDEIYSSATLYVPAGSESAYKDADSWEDFASIKTF